MLFTYLLRLGINRIWTLNNKKMPHFYYIYYKANGSEGILKLEEIGGLSFLNCREWQTFAIFVFIVYEAIVMKFELVKLQIKLINWSHAMHLSARMRKKNVCYN